MKKITRSILKTVWNIVKLGVVAAILYAGMKSLISPTTVALLLGGGLLFAFVAAFLRGVSRGLARRSSRR